MLTLSIKPASLERRTRPLRGQSSRPALTHVVLLAAANRRALASGPRMILTGESGRRGLGPHGVALEQVLGCQVGKKRLGSSYRLKGKGKEVTRSEPLMHHLREPVDDEVGAPNSQGDGRRRQVAAVDKRVEIHWSLTSEGAAWRFERSHHKLLDRELPAGQSRFCRPALARTN